MNYVKQANTLKMKKMLKYTLLLSKDHIVTEHTTYGRRSKWGSTERAATPKNTNPQ